MANIYTLSILSLNKRSYMLYFGQSFDCMDGKTNSIYFKTDNNVGFFLPMPKCL